ncbi:DUF4097 family beta strand repeat-containing protein [uncultured Maribacter sp.]|uniref:DUF4097 family beta strand repeat-containing protein n=1 Tax=uncultured Maribacter sp. TaxID=431308 RepID=UPI00260C7D6A|nr:DUF4097 family beta strand repeat-containing protein [uncultured Maribacter sp.]
MKNITAFLLLSLISLTTYAQKTIEKNIEYNQQFIDVEVKFASLIEVKTWDKSSVYFKATISTKDNKHQDKYKLRVNEGSNTISINSEAKPLFKAFHKEWNDNNPNKKRRYYNTGDIYEFNYVIYVPKNAKFKISSINGDLKSEVIEGEFEANLINGNIDIAKYSGELELSTINGEIDLKMVDANLIAKTIHGDIYADDKLKFTSKDRHVGQKISGSLGNGSNQLRLNTINGNIYLRR